ncbi:MAG: exosome complex RNA-binding protein Rrp4 [Acidilobaceae archaeon]|nr:exosome complex RNA-binding protein Rrp4 [Acidilobaceae archaeon]MCX8165150.1 exosome complex RNA-binding protein Rrp4 [Acidilobaceae archaeon]MDW7974334.1 exosome complex RNA-binding protein Rrp4 [Sulfolobales archaeon]
MKTYGQIVLPGDRLDSRVEAERPFVTEVGQEKVATVLGMISQREGKGFFVPLKSIYVPKPGDIVIGLVEAVAATSWNVDINSPYSALLYAQDFLGRSFNPSTDDLYQILKPGEYLKARIFAFDKTRSPLLTVQGEGLGKLIKGAVIDVPPAKIPRIIGKKRSMTALVEEKTGCSLFPATNGRVHVDCPSPELEAVAIMAIKLIEREAHIPGLTERVANFIEEERRRKGI